MLCYFCLTKSVSSVCNDCKGQLNPRLTLLPPMPNICLGAYFYEYSDVIQTIIRDMKFHGNIRLGTLIQNQLLSTVFPDIFNQSDVIVSVRSHWLRQLFRGRAHIPYLFHHFIEKNNRYQPKYLTRVRFSRSSYRLSRKQRQRHFQRFYWRSNLFQFSACNQHKMVSSVTILDDICTTGSTLISIARLLKSHGIDTVKVLVIAYVKKTT